MNVTARFAGQRCLGIVSPSAPSVSHAHISRLKSVFGGLTVVLPRSVEHLHEVVARSGDEYPLVLAIGGDGTISQVVQRLNLESQVLAILPAGTGNDLARGLSLPRRMRSYLQELPNFRIREIDVWLINGRRFVNSAGFGLDAQVLATMSSSRGILARNYVLAFITTLPKLRTFSIRAIGDGETLVDGEAWWLVAMNSPFIGGGIPIAPNAKLDDGKLDIVAIHTCSQWELALKLPKVIAGKHLKDGRVSYHQTGCLTVESLDNPAAVEGDGELLAIDSDHFELKRGGRLKVLCAAASTR